MSFPKEKINHIYNIDPMSVIDPKKCMARKNMTNDINIQCPCKRKIGFEFCGRHYKSKKICRIDKPYFKLSNFKLNNKLGNKLDNKIIKKKKQPILIDYKYYNTNNILKKVYLSDLKYSLKNYGLSSKGKKKILIERLCKFLKNVSYCADNIDKITLIQSICRMKLVQYKIKIYGPAVFNRKVCVNKTDFFTLEGIDSIPEEYFYSYKDNINFIYGFDIRSLNELIKVNQPNPYNREPFNNNVTSLVNNRVNMLIERNKAVQYEQPKLTPEQELRNKVIIIFQKIDELGYHTNIDWFMNLSIIYLKRYYRILEDIWKYRAQLTMEARLRIVTTNNVFTTSYRRINKIHKIDKLRNVVLTEIDKLVSNGINDHEKTLGSLYVLTGLTGVSRGCAETYHWLVQ